MLSLTKSTPNPSKKAFLLLFPKLHEIPKSERDNNNLMIRHYTVFVKAPLRAAATGIFDVDVGTCFRPVLLASPAISW